MEAPNLDRAFESVSSSSYVLESFALDRGASTSFFRPWRNSSALPGRDSFPESPIPLN